MPRFQMTHSPADEPVEIVLADGTVYTFAPDCPAGLLIRLQSVDPQQQAVEAMKLIDLLAIGETKADMAIRMESIEKPISIPMLMELIEKLMEAYTDRPTTGPNGSSTSPSAVGSTSTPAAPSPASTPSPSPAGVS